jgi:hypothetical protein
MNINDILNTKCATVDKVEVSQTVFQETEPYSISKTITGTNIYIWNKKFIDKVMESFSTTIVQNFSKKEKVLFDKYVNFLINGTTGTLDEDVRELDTYIGTIKGDYL